MPAAATSPVPQQTSAATSQPPSPPPPTQQATPANPAAAAPAADPSPFKLKPKAPAPVPDKAAGGVSLANWPTAEIVLPTVPGGSSATSAHPFPDTAPAAVPPLPKPIHIPARGLVKAETGAPEKPEQSQAFKLGVTISLIAAGLVLCVGGFFGWKHFSKGKSPRTQTAPAASGATVPKAGEAPKSSATSAVGAAHPVEPIPTPAPTGELVKADDGPVRLTLDDSVPPRNTSLTPVSNSSSVPTALAPGVTANMGVPISNIGASPEFRAFVANVKISGVFQGANSRALINGRMTRVGEPVDSTLGVIFEGIDPEKKQIIFKDASGATATRKY
jgi:hypothetical protein